ncbi:MAG: iron-regulated protein [Rhizobacter sp.]|nr:iron-regulated protein [Bacteriovorax sp.]
MKSTKLMAIALMLCFSFSTFAAKKSSKKESVTFPESVAANIVADYSKHVFNTYSELLKVNKNLEAAVAAFTKNPSVATQDAAKKAWQDARYVYSATEAFRFYGGPIDDAKTGPEGLMNAWPLDEAYIDYVKGNADAGIINNTKLFPKITKEVIVAQNEKDGEKNVSTGYHAIEFLLWGQDMDLKSAGKRSFEDYIPAKSANAERRATYINLVAAILVEHSQQLLTAWDPAVKGNFVESFLKAPPHETIQKMFLGIGTLAMDEMSGERMTVPLEKNDQENEQDCFSDLTHLDFIRNQEGILAVYTGKYEGFNGIGLKAFITAIDPKGEPNIQNTMDKTLSMFKELKPPFDNIIMEKKNGPGRKLSNKIIASLQTQSKLIAKSISKVGMDINIEHK